MRTVTPKRYLGVEVEGRGWFAAAAAKKREPHAAMDPSRRLPGTISLSYGRGEEGTVTAVGDSTGRIRPHDFGVIFWRRPWSVLRAPVQRSRVRIRGGEEVKAGGRLGRDMPGASTDHALAALEQPTYAGGPDRRKQKRRGKKIGEERCQLIKKLQTKLIKKLYVYEKLLMFPGRIVWSVESTL